MMLVVAEAAAADMAEAAAWYDGHRRGVGDEFLAAVDSLLEQIGDHPMRYRVAHAALRLALVPRFPYCVFYRVEKERILVLAVTHGRRDPRQWKQRDT